MEFNIYSRYNAFDMASEVNMVVPLLLLADKLSYVADIAFIIEEHFKVQPMSEKMIIITHKIFYKENFENLDHDSFLESYMKLRNRNGLSKPELIMLEKGKKLIAGMKKNVEGYLEHYCMQYGFLPLGLFIKNQLKLFPNNYKKNDRLGRDEYVDYFQQLLTETDQIAAVTDEFDLVMDVQRIHNGEAPVRADAVVFPLLTFPVLKRITEEQLLALYKDLRSAAASFCAHLTELNEQFREISFTEENLSELTRQLTGKLNEDSAAISKLLNNHLYIQQFRNSFPEDGEVQIFAGITSLSKFLDAYEKLGIFEPYRIPAILEIVSSTITGDKCILFLYTVCTAPEVKACKEVAAKKRAEEAEDE